MATLCLVDFTSAEFCRLVDANSPAEGSLSSSANWHFSTPESVSVDRPFAMEYWTRLCDLPSDQSARCHIPSYGIRFLDGTDSVGGASICWQCNNVYLRFRDLSAMLTFDGESPAAQELLAEMKLLFTNA